MSELESTPIFEIPTLVFVFNWRFFTRQNVVIEIFVVCCALENKGNFWFNMVNNYTYLPLLENPFNDNNSKNINTQGQKELEDLQPQMRINTVFSEREISQREW